MLDTDKKPLLVLISRFIYFECVSKFIDLCVHWGSLNYGKITIARGEWGEDSGERGLQELL